MQSFKVVTILNIWNNKTLRYNIKIRFSTKLYQWIRFLVF